MPEGNGFIMNECDGNRGPCPPPQGLPKADFSTLIVSLYSTALVQMGEMPDPGTGVKTRNLDLARQTVDLIAMLREKTTGNLDEEEARLVGSLLQELQMSFVKAKERS